MQPLRSYWPSQFMVKSKILADKTGLTDYLQLSCNIQELS